MNSNVFSNSILRNPTLRSYTTNFIPLLEILNQNKSTVVEYPSRNDICLLVWAKLHPIFLIGGNKFENIDRNSQFNFESEK